MTIGIAVALARDGESVDIARTLETPLRSSGATLTELRLVRVREQRSRSRS